ncbi:MAG TPA: hypothetical protein DC056_16390, partial [Dehalococcoidia bacterium]|nr:hypothetical protein [Dehalococcoidia bacterium]
LLDGEGGYRVQREGRFVHHNDLRLNGQSASDTQPVLEPFISIEPVSPGELGSESAFDSAHPANRRVRVEKAISHNVSWKFSEFEESKFILNLLESIERRVHRGQRLFNGALRFEM